MFRIACLSATMALIATTLAHPLHNTATDSSLAAYEKPWTCGFKHSSNDSTVAPSPYENFVQMSALDDGKNITVPTVIHFVSTGDTLRRESEDVNRIITRMNTAYAPAGIQFTLRNWTQTVDPIWAVTPVDTLFEVSEIVAPAAALPVSFPFKDMKSKLHQGGYDTLNLYYPAHPSGDVLGVCKFPVKDPSAAQVKTSGCIVAGPTWDEDNAAVAVHEVGHWFGLYHTFDEESCDDQVADTPPAGVPSGDSGNFDTHAHCPNVRDCDGEPMPQIAHNWMDYIPPACMNEFTPLQSQRMRLNYRALRAGKSE